ncbi:MAG: class I SAM-dependent methyltransferase [Bdellovibrionaceae bacterium]|nr:class I SAM-dependent methyltransferase [Pseudobdellovibrionaceae bacterium]
MSANINDESVKNQWRLKEWFPDLTEKTLASLQAFFDLVIQHNKTISLVSPKTLPVSDALHFADSIIASQIIVEASPGIKKMYDFGSGSGFPGIVFAILYPHIEMSLVEADLRKVEFLKQASSALALTNVKVLHSTIESLPSDSVTHAITRGFGNISKTILLARKPIAKGGIVYHMKNEQWGLEVTEIPTQLCSIWFPALVQEYVLPSTQIRFGVVKTTKN